jgi:hypothetical protein
MSEDEKWNNLFIINPSSRDHFQFDKWGLPIKREETEQLASVESEHLKRKQWSQQTLNQFLCGDPFITFNPTPKVLCGKVIVRANLPTPNHHQQQQPKPQPHHQVEEEAAAPNPLEYPTSTQATTSGASSRMQSVSLPSSPTTDSALWSDKYQGFEQDLWDLTHNNTQTTTENTSSPSPTLSLPNSPQPGTSKQYLNQEIGR